MMTKKDAKILKGNPWWALAYALTSIKNYPTRNLGIMLVLAISVALPTTVFVWSNTGSELVIDQYFTDSLYQMSLIPKPDALYTQAEYDNLLTTINEHPFVEYLDEVTSTVGILMGNEIDNWTQYDINDLNYAKGIKDGRVIFVTPTILGNWSHEFTYEGNFSLKTGQVLVSRSFIESTQEVHHVVLNVGSVIDLDVLMHKPRSTVEGTPSSTKATRLKNLTIAGIYQINDLRSKIGQGFPSMSRKNWDPFDYPTPVLGIEDSVMLLVDDMGSENVAEIRTRGYFNSAVFIRASKDALIDAGSRYIGQNLLAFKAQMEEQYPKFIIQGVEDIWSLEASVQTYLNSQILTIIVFPVLIMSLMLTVFTSETSVLRRKGEISSLRSKGASFNQIFATFMWESLILGLLGFIVGLFLALIMAPMIGATRGIFLFNINDYLQYLAHLSIPPLSIVIAAAIAMYLPAAYLLHVARQIDVSEVGQPMTAYQDSGAEETGVIGYVVGLAIILSFLLILPKVILPLGFFAIIEILIATLILFIASYLGSRVMRRVTSRLSRGTNFIIGEKSLYLSQSLKKRKGQFIPLLVILTLTLTTTTMMLIQTSSYEATLNNELRYAIGADMRIECDARPLDFNKTLLKYPGILKATPVIETWAQVGSESFFLEGVDPSSYLDIGDFRPESFVSGTPEQVLTALQNKSNGILISDYFSTLWNISIGEQINVYYGTANGSRLGTFEIVGVMKSAPGFGVASTKDIAGASFASQFGFQAGLSGFALVNLDFLMSVTQIETADLFLVKTVSFVDLNPVIESLETQRSVTVYTADTFDLATQSYAIHLFLSGIQGLTIISFVMCTVMGLLALALFLGSAVLERQTEYAIFRAIGGTKKQVISMVFGEFAGIVVAAIGISLLLGVAFGYSMSILTFGISPFSPVLTEVFYMPLTTMFILIILEGIVMIASCYLPAVRAGSINPATALRNL